MEHTRSSILSLFKSIKRKLKIESKNKKQSGKVMAASSGDPHANYTPQDRLRGLPYEATASGKPPRTEEPETSPEPPSGEQNKLKKRAPERIATDLTGVAQELDKKLQ